ncbi:MAG: sodium transporter [Gemmatimonadetes bacterium]|nr:Na+:solute symporter [Gemmatimonadota bacterium]NIR77673.1 Na+:solute symporter [Gemmatimonadota bacterium]NIT86215.1 Na+:solute symporter [Gemmatimonadota bacterium]NIU30040.1 Na+:solute symporter [Gemmatimonadota bacterium]NIU34999.1 sodium transporter [Gemmatimonadota bacterium]
MIDLLIVLAFVVYAVTSGFRAREKASRGLDEYFLAGKTLKGWQAGTSMAATQFAADTPLLVTGLVATAGVFAVWRLWVYGLAFLMMAFILAAHWREAGVLTDAELTEIRYSGRGVLALRVLKAIYYGTVINCVVLAMVLVAAVRIAEVFLPWHEWIPSVLYGPVVAWVGGTGVEIASGVTGLGPEVATTNNLVSILVIVGFTTLYSMTGGLRSVVATDVVQFTLAIVGTGAYAWVVVDEVGGLGALGRRLGEIYGVAEARTMLSFAPPDGEALMPFLVIVGLQWFFQMNSDGTGYLAQRSMACETDADARAAGVVFAWLQIFLRSLFWLVIAVGLLVLYPFDPAAAGGEAFAASREILFVTGIEDYLPSGLRGLMLVGLLAALASTVDTHLNWGASYWSNDVYKRLVTDRWLDRKPSRGELVVIARLSNLLILSVALAVMVNLGSIQTAWFVSLLFGAGMGSVLVLRWLWERINLWSEVAAIGVSLGTAPLLLAVTDQEWIRLGTMAVVSTVAAVGVTFFTPSTDAGVLRAFYRRVRPDGFWSRTASQVGVDPGTPMRRLRRGVRYAVLSAASLFLALAGVGRLVVPSPEKSLAIPVTMVVAALILIPFWLPGLLSPEEDGEAAATRDEERAGPAEAP